MEKEVEKLNAINSELLEALEWIRHHALQKGCSKEALKSVADEAIKRNIKLAVSNQ